MTIRVQCLVNRKQEVPKFFRTCVSLQSIFAYKNNDSKQNSATASFRIGTHKTRAARQIIVRDALAHEDVAHRLERTFFKT